MLSIVSISFLSLRVTLFDFIRQNDKRLDSFMIDDEIKNENDMMLYEYVHSLPIAVFS